MRLQLPKSEAHPLVKVILVHPQGESHSIFDDRHHEVDLVLPEGVHEDDVAVFAGFCLANEKIDERIPPITLKERVKRAPAPPVVPLAPPTPVQPDAPAASDEAIAPSASDEEEVGEAAKPEDAKPEAAKPEAPVKQSKKNK